MAAAFRRIAPVAFLGAFPLLFLALAADVARSGHVLGLDFSRELYPEAKLVLHGVNPFPGPDVALKGADLIWPIPAVLLVSPLTLLPLPAAAYVWCFASVLMLAGALRLLGVKDWRVYGIVALWAPTLAELQTGNLTIALALLVAAAWRLRERRFSPGVAIGLAVALKLFLWPLGVWLLVRRRFASTAVAAIMGAATLLLILPFESLADYVTLMRRVATKDATASYSPLGLLIQSGVASGWHARVAACVVGVVVLALAAYRRSLPLTIAASLLLSPTVWLHYFVLLVVPLALRRPRFGPVWFLPLLFWFCPGEDAHLRHIAVALLLLTAVVAVSESRRLAARLDLHPRRLAFSTGGFRPR